ncbi:MAG TPA: AAA family ATPase [Nitrosopumilaceae archaeon]|nr:AAA family ATPase [Nitrosopumilaceae archaeon]
MKIHKLSFKNFRSFKDKSTLDDVKPISTFVGSNSAGKSNIIEILSFLRKMANHEWIRPFADLTFDRNKNPIKIEIEFEKEVKRILEIIRAIDAKVN